MQDSTLDKYSVVWDLETTGFVPPEAKVLEIGANIVRKNADGTTSVEVKHWVLNHNIEIPEKIAENHITHNGIRFDIPFLVGHCQDILGWSDEDKKKMETRLKSNTYDTAVHFKAKKTGMKQRDGEHYIDFATRVMDYRAFGVKFNLGLCVQEEGIDTTGINFHRALGDVAMTYRLYLAITEPVEESCQCECHFIDVTGCKCKCRE